MVWATRALERARCTLIPSPVALIPRLEGRRTFGWDILASMLRSGVMVLSSWERVCAPSAGRSSGVTTLLDAMASPAGCCSLSGSAVINRGQCTTVLGIALDRSV